MPTRRRKAETFDAQSKDLLDELDPNIFGGLDSDIIYDRLSETDPRLKENQMEALRQLMEVSRQGYTPTDKASMQLAMNDQNQADRIARENITARASRLGGAGSGLELGQQLLANQQGSMNRSDIARRNAVDSRNRAYQAMLQGGQLAGQVRDQNTSIDRFNVDMMNKQKTDRYDREMEKRQRDYSNRMGLASAKSGALSSSRDYYENARQNANNNFKDWTKIIRK
jgi:hypothetical protein